MITIITAEIARTLSDSLIIPFRATNYGLELDDLFADLVEEYGNDLKEQGIGLDDLSKIILKYKNESEKFHQRLNSINRTQ